MALKLYTVHCGASRELSCYPRARHQGLTLLAEILTASADGHRDFCGILRTQGTLEGAGTPCPWLAASAPLWPLGENELHPWQTTEPHCRVCSLLGKDRGPSLFFPCGSGRGKRGRRADASWRVPRSLAQMSASPVPPFTPSLAFRSCSVPLSLVCLYPHFVPSWSGKPGMISTWALSSLQLPPCGTDAKWLLADGLPADACPADVHPPAANPTSLGREATSACCSLFTLPTNTDCSRPLTGPSRMSQAPVDRGFGI